MHFQKRFLMAFITFPLFFSNPRLPQELWRAARQSQQPSHSCLCTFREKASLVSHPSSHFCNHLVTLIDQRNFASAHSFKGLLKKFTIGRSNLGERQGLTLLNARVILLIMHMKCPIHTGLLGMQLYTGSQRFPTFRCNVIQLLLNTHNHLQRTCISMATSSPASLFN